MSDSHVPKDRTRIHRIPARGRYDTATIHAILDEGFICHVAFVDDGCPHVLPTLYVRSGNQLYVHGSSVGRMMRVLGAGVDACVSVTIVDGLVLARSAMHHALNFRSVVAFGRGRTVTDPTEKENALRLLTDRLVKNRWAEVRPPNNAEMELTSVVALPIDEASAKVRTGPPVDDEQDYALPVWAGVVPVRMWVGAPMDDGRVEAGVAPIDLARVGIARR